MKPGAPFKQSTRLRDQVRKRVRYLHYSLKNKNDYFYRNIFLSAETLLKLSSMRHPLEMGVADVEALFSALARERRRPPPLTTKHSVLCV